MVTKRWYERALPVLDFETTGVDPFECRPVSVAADEFTHVFAAGAVVATGHLLFHDRLERIRE